LDNIFGKNNEEISPKLEKLDLIWVLHVFKINK